MRTWTGWSCTAAVGAVVVLGLAACNGGDDRPTTSATSSTTPSSSTSSSSTATSARPSTTTSATVDPAKLPAEATEKTEAGATAFARYFLERTSQAAHEGDPTLMDGLSSKNCSGCAAFRKLVADRAAKGQHTDINSLRIDLSQALPGSTPSKVVVGLLVTDRRKRVVDKDGQVVQTVRGAKFNTEATLIWVDGSWNVDALRLVR